MVDTSRRRITPLIVTTSWDDGHRLDMRTADLLQRNGMTGTFYVSPRNREISPGDRLPPADLRTLAANHEVGSHTLTHPRLTKVPRASAWNEIAAGKAEIEEQTGCQVRSFAYPAGLYRPEHVSMVARSGHVFGRTTRRWVQNEEPDPFRAGTTVHAFRHPRDVFAAARAAGARVGRSARLLFGWDRLAMAMFDRAYETGDLFHLWGHSWEIDRNDDWQRLERLLSYLASREDVRYGTNRDLITGGSAGSQWDRTNTA